MAIDDEFFTFNIRYNRGADDFEVEGDLNKQGQREVVEAFLSMQRGAGEDKRNPNKKDFYNISLDWYPHYDKIKIRDDTGNKGLREGILMRFLGYIGD